MPPPEANEPLRRLTRAREGHTAPAEHHLRATRGSTPTSAGTGGPPRFFVLAGWPCHPVTQLLRQHCSSTNRMVGLTAERDGQLLLEPAAAGCYLPHRAVSGMQKWELFLIRGLQVAGGGGSR